MRKLFVLFTSAIFFKISVRCRAMCNFLCILSLKDTKKSISKCKTETDSNNFLGMNRISGFSKFLQKNIILTLEEMQNTFRVNRRQISRIKIYMKILFGCTLYIYVHKCSKIYNSSSFYVSSTHFLAMFLCHLGISQIQFRKEFRFVQLAYKVETMWSLRSIK